MASTAPDAAATPLESQPGESSPKPSAIQDIRDWIKINQKRTERTDEDYKKLSVAAVATGTVLSLVRQRMLGKSPLFLM